MPIRWELLDPARVEDLLSSLLNVLHPDRAQRIDGTGGDGGRDVQLVLADGVHLFEIKSRTGRMRNTRRRQVERSLARATLLGPKSWTLLAPVDPNPTEEKWFRELRKETSFPIEWRGRSWLDTEMAKRPYLERYWLGDAAAEVKRLLELARQEEAGLARGAIDAMERTRRVVDLLNESNPFYRFQITTDGESSSITPIPRYRGAERDFPIVFHVTFAFPNTSEAQAVADELRAAFDFGTVARIPSDYIREVEVKAPIPLVPKEGAHSIEIGPAAGTRRTIPMIFGVLRPDGSSLGEVPITMTLVSKGERGAKLEGADRSGILNVDLTLLVEERRATGNMTVKHPREPYFANEVRDAIRVVKHMAVPNTLEFRSLDGLMVSKGGSPWDESPVEEGFPEFLDDLVLIQWASGLNRPVGPAFSPREFVDVEEAGRLLRGEALVGTWTGFQVTLSEDAPPETRRVLAGEPHAMRIVARKPHEVRVTGTDYPVGEAVENTFDSVVLAPEHRAELIDGLLPVGVPLRFVPGTSEKLTRRLVKASPQSPRASLKRRRSRWARR